MFAWLRKHNIAMWALSLLVAIVFWAYVMVVQNPERTTTVSGIIPVFVGEDRMRDERGLLITQGKTTPVTLNLRGRQTDLNKITAENIKITVDLSIVNSKGRIPLAYSVELPAEVRERVTYERTSDYLTLGFDLVRTRDIPVRLKLEGTIAEGYVKLQEILQPETIKVTGPATEVDTIATAQVVLQRENISKTIESTPLTFTLMNAGGAPVQSAALSFDVTEVLVTVPIEMEKAVPLMVDFIDGGGLLQDRNITYAISPRTVSLAGSPEVLNAVNSIRLATIDLAKLLTGAPQEFPIVLPDGTRSLSGEEKAVVTIEIHGVSTIQLSTVNLQMVGGQPPSGYEIVLVTTQMTVKLRGPEETLALIQPHSLRAAVDLSDVDLVPGTITVPAKVQIDGYSDVGVVGDYSAVVLVRPPEEDNAGG